MSAVVASESTVPGSRVWDLPVRLVHWSMAVCFFGAWRGAENDGQRLLHMRGALPFGLSAGAESHARIGGHDDGRHDDDGHHGEQAED